MTIRKKVRVMRGRCLCGKVEFELIGKTPNLYQCHCSLCQKATGSSSCSAFITNKNNINWISGKEEISSYTKENGFRTDFCRACGSPVPNIMNIGEYLWVPAGILEGFTNTKIAAHLHIDSKASWETDTKNCKRFPEGPESIDEFITILYDD